jgi:hypothetical protein
VVFGSRMDWELSKTSHSLSGIQRHREGLISSYRAIRGHETGLEL